MTGGHFKTHFQSALSLLSLAALACAMFGFAASVVIGVAVAVGKIDQPAALAYRMLVKACFFAMVSVLAVVILWRFRQRGAETEPPFVIMRMSPKQVLGVFALVCLGAVFFLPRLNTYPYPEPDELHHLVVARNIAIYGEYASGQPPEPLVHFDPYDSVGPAVLLPVAAALKAGGVSLIAGRLPIVVCFLALIVLSIRLFASLIGPASALLGGLFLILAWGSIYLARTVYGEVPALMFFVAALLCWRRSLEHAPWRWALAAGVLLGLATLAKAIMLLTAFPFAAVVMHDRITHHRLRLPHVLMPAFGVVIVQAAWLVAIAVDPDSGPEGSTIGLYQHYLMFGFGGVPAAVHWIASNQLVFLVMSSIGLIVLSPAIMTGRDPAARVAMLTGVLYLFWWSFFTDAHIPRYLWFSIALLAFPFAFVLRRLAALALQRPFGARTIGAAALVVACCAPFGPLVNYEFGRIFGTVELGVDERRAMGHLEAFPREMTFATTWWPLERWSHFFLNRPMTVVEDAAAAVGTSDVVIARDAQQRGETLIPSVATRRMGPYTLYWKEP